MADVAILILAGGHSERFGEIKAFYELKGKPLIQHVFDRVSRISLDIVISCKSGREKLVEMFPRAKVVEDEPNESGPLVGMLSSLPKIDSEYVVVLSCDAPKIKPEVIELLVKKGKGHSAAVPRWPNGYLEPLQALYRTDELKKSVRKAWEEGKMKLSELIDMLPDVVYVSTEEISEKDSEMESFINLNYPEDVESAFE